MNEGYLILKGLFGGKKNYSKLQKKTVVGKDGKKHTVYYDPNKGQTKDGRTPKEKEIAKRKEFKAKQDSIKERPKDDPEVLKKQIEETKARHKEFEELAKKQRKMGWGSGPVIPKPNTVMRVYAQGKANVGGMLAKVEQVLNNGQDVMVQLASGKYFTMPIGNLQFAKSEFAKGKIKK